MKKNILILLCIGACIVGITLFLKKDPSPVLSSCTIRHLGIIMDGNRRWAKRNGFKPWIGHKQGVEPVKTTLKFCLENKIPYVTLYAFSLENFKRSAQELHYLFDILAQEIASKELESLFEQGIKVTFIGDKSRFPEQLHETIDTVQEKTKNGDKLHMNILFCYGGQQEIVATTKKLAQQVQAGTLQPEDITPELFEKSLWTNGTPAPDLILRTGGAQRLSNFLTYQSAYSEILFLNCFWPDLTNDDLINAVNKYESSQRNFGA